MLRIIQYKTLLGVLFVIYINLYFCLKVIHYYKGEKEEEKKKQCLIDAHPGIDPGPLIKESDALTTRLQGQIDRRLD